MTAPRSRGLPRRRFREVVAERPPLEGPWIVQVSFRKEGPFEINFMVTWAPGGPVQAGTRLPVQIASVLRRQLLAVHDSMRHTAQLPANPVWHSDVKVVAGPSQARLRRAYIKRLMSAFGKECQSHNLPGSMVLYDGTGRPVSATGTTSTTSTAVANSPEKAKKVPAKKTATKKAVPTSKKAAAKKTAAKKAVAKVPAKPNARAKNQ